MTTNTPQIPADHPICRDIDWALATLEGAELRGARALIEHTAAYREGILALHSRRMGGTAAAMDDIWLQREIAAGLVRLLPITWGAAGRPVNFSYISEESPRWSEGVRPINDELAARLRKHLRANGNDAVTLDDDNCEHLLRRVAELHDAGGAEHHDGVISIGGDSPFAGNFLRLPRVA
jgi:hypothetical protein